MQSGGRECLLCKGPEQGLMNTQVDVQVTRHFLLLRACCRLSFRNESEGFRLGLPVLKLENSSARQQHQWPELDLAELISREANQLEKCKFVFCTELETHYAEPLLKLSSGQ